VLVRFGLITYEFMARDPAYAHRAHFHSRHHHTPTPDVITTFSRHEPADGCALRKLHLDCLVS